MDKNELKRILKKQASLFPSDIQKKMIYLQSESFLGEDFYQYDLSSGKENDLLEAFIDIQNNEEEPVEIISQSFEVMQNLSQSSKIISPQIDKAKTDFQERRKNLTARIASLRGTSLPGSYLQKK